MGKVLGIVLILLGVFIWGVWPMPFLGDVSPLGIIWNTLLGIVLIVVGVISFSMGRRA